MNETRFSSFPSAVPSTVERREGRRLCLFASRTISHFSSLGDVSSAAKREKNARSCSRKPVEAGFSDFIACRWIYLAPEWWTARIRNRAGKKLGSLKERVRRKSRGVVDRSNGVSSAFFPRYAAYRNLMIGESDWNSWKYSDSLIKYFIETKCNKIRLNPYLELIFCETGKISHRAIFLLYTYRFILFSFDDLFLDYF